MTNTFFNELRNVSKQLDFDAIPKIIEAYKRIIHYQNVARKEGLLELEEESEKLNLDDETESYFHMMIELIVDGTDSNLLKEIGLNRYIASKSDGCNGLVMLMYYKGSIMIQAGDNPRIVELYIKSMMPEKALEALRISEYEDKQREKSSARTEVESLCQGNDKEIDETDLSIANQTAVFLMKLSDIEMQRLLREARTSDINLAMVILPGRARRCIFNNLSDRLGEMIAQDVAFLGPIRLKDAEESCVSIMKTLIKLFDMGEINDYGFEKLKVIIDIYDAHERYRESMRKKYREVKRLIDQIYES